MERHIAEYSLTPEEAAGLASKTMDIITDGLYWCDREARIVYVNEGACRALGFSREELQGKTVLDIDPGLSRERWQGKWEVMDRDGRIELESVHRRRDGSCFPISVSSDRVEYNGLELCCAVVRDISEQKKIKEQLESSESMFRALFEKAPIGVAYHEMIYDEAHNYKDYRILAANASYKRLTGVEAMGKLVTEAFPGIENDPFDWIGTFGKVARTGCEVRFQQYLQPNGRWYDCVGYQSRPDQFVAAFLEISEQKKAEQLLEAKNRELEQILYVASHDLRTPLVNINGYAQEVQERWEALLEELRAGPAYAQTYMQKLEEGLNSLCEDMAFIQRSTQQLNRLMDGLLKVSRLGRGTLERVPVDMNTLLKRIGESFDFQLRAVAGTLEVGNLPPCKGDALLLNQVFSNLIGNAIKYRDTAKSLRITVDGRLEDGMLVYEVSDNGIGIAEEHRDKVFELFYRLNPRATEGEGIGLTIVRQAVERLGGSIRLYTEPGSGCRFTVLLPMGEP